METTKLKTVDFEHEGRVYRLTCNMNVLADVQEAYDGKLLKALNQTGGYKSTITFLAAMLTEAADSQSVADESGLPLRFRPREIGRTLSVQEVNEIGHRIWPLIEAAVLGDGETNEPGEAEKN